MKPLVLILLGLLAACAAPVPEPLGPDNRAPDLGEPGEPDYHVLMAEIAMQRDRPALAATEYLRAARASEDLELAERAARVTAAYGTGEEALAAARHWAALAPGATLARRFLARGYLRSDKAEMAIPELARLRADAGDAGRPFLALLPLLTAAEDREAARAALAAVVADYPEDASGAYAHAYLALRAGDAALAEAEAGRALSLAPEWTEAVMLRARAMAADGGVEEALAWLADRPDAGSRELRLERALMLMTAERNREARRLLKDILAATPGDADALRALGYLEYFAGRPEAAREAFMSLLASGRHTDDAAFYLGGLAEQAGDLEEAARLYAGVTDGEHLVTAQVRLALLMFRMGRPELAVRHLQVFAQTHPQAATELGMARAELLQRLGEPEEALAVYDGLLRRYPDNAMLLYARGMLRIQGEDVEKALADFERMVELRPDDPTALNAFGFTLADLTGRHVEAYALISRALEMAPDSPAILDSMGWVLFRLGRAEEGLPYIQRSWTLQRDPEIAAHLGELLWSLGRVDEARDVWLEAIVDFPDSRILLETMGRLDP